MAEAHDDRGSDRRVAARSPDAERGAADAVKFAELRSILTGPERRELVDLKAHLADREARAIQVREVLPEAIALIVSDPHFVNALTPAVEQAIRVSARKDPRPLADALLPVVGRSLGKAMAQALTPLITLGLAVLLVGGVWAFQAYRSRQQWNAYLERLAAQPGIVVIQSGHQNGKLFIRGFRDELAVDPATLLAESGMAPETVDSRWEPYQALHPDFVTERARELLRPPAGVTLEFREGVLLATGPAPAEWVTESRRLAPALDGVRRFEFAPKASEPPEIAGTTPAAPEPPPPSPQPREAKVTPAAPRPTAPERTLMEQIEVSTLVFSPNHRDLTPGQDATVRRLAALFRELNEMLHARGARARIEFVANISESSSVADTALAATRLNAALALFRTFRFDSLVLTANTETSSASGSELSRNDRDWNRRVSFRVRLLPRS